MKRYLVFAFDDYYPKGGMNDCKRSFGTIEEAENYCKGNGAYDHYQIFDTETGDVVKITNDYY